jgi:hypothetical protein
MSLLDLLDDIRDRYRKVFDEVKLTPQQEIFNLKEANKKLEFMINTQKQEIEKQ